MAVQTRIMALIGHALNQHDQEEAINDPNDLAAQHDGWHNDMKDQANPDGNHSEATVELESRLASLEALAMAPETTIEVLRERALWLIDYVKG